MDNNVNLFWTQLLPTNEEKKVFLGKRGQTRFSKMKCLLRKNLTNTGHEHSVSRSSKDNRGVGLMVPYDWIKILYVLNSFNLIVTMLY